MFKIIDTPLSKKELDYIKNFLTEPVFPFKNKKMGNHIKTKKDYRVKTVLKKMKEYNENKCDK